MLGRINRPGPPSGEQAHLEGLRDELAPDEKLIDGVVYRTVRWCGFEMLTPVRMLPWKRKQLLDPLANAKVAAHTFRRRSETRADFIRRLLP